ncbi:MAG TPA: Ig-like domain-containing protein [Solirubrobacteraceae bacterium]
MIGVTVGALAALVLLLAGPVAAADASVTLDHAPSGFTSQTLPSFSGTTNDPVDPVVLRILEGTSTEGALAQELSTGLGSLSEEWSLTATSALPQGTYTAVAEQGETLGLAEPERSRPTTFTVDTTAPAVSLEPIASPTSDATPTLGGEAGEASGDLNVHVTIRRGETVVASKEVAPSGGRWSLTAPHLADGSYRAEASQSDQAGNEGSSSTRTFTVDTVSPTVTLHQPTSPSNNTTPSFTGYASASTPVEIEIRAGNSTSGPVLASASAEGNEGEWASGATSPALASGTYTAVAVQSSPAGNPPGVSSPVSFTVNTNAPHVTLDQPRSPYGDTTPSFTGSASEETPVEIDIYSGASAEGTPVATAAATGTGRSFASGQASPALAAGQYTAIATQESSLFGNPTGYSAPVTFVIDTSSPHVTLTQPPSPSNHSTPTFSGSASDTTAVVVQIFNAGHTQVASATATPSGGSWSANNESSLPSGTYSAVATQSSSLGNAAGVSNEVSFTVETAPPTVTLASPAALSNNTTPTFTGTASDTTTVTVQIYRGTRAEGTVVSSATASGTGAGWTSSAASPALADGQYTARATQQSSLGNGPGTSPPVTFTVDTSSPGVTLDQPASPSNHTTPSFTGTASATTQVTVVIRAGTQTTGTILSRATAAGSGAGWSSSAASPSLASGQYTAVAEQPSPVEGNPPGKSAPMTFVINTAPPQVTLTPPSQTLSNNTTPSFKGTASDTTPVTVAIYAGTQATGTIVATASAGGTGASWSSTAASPPLASGQYTAIASQPSSLEGNGTGTSAPTTFTVDTSSPTVTLNQPASPSNNTTPTFTGSASAKLPVTIRIYEGTSTLGSEVAHATATGTGGSWTSGSVSQALAHGSHTYTARAEQESPLGNPAGQSQAVTFTVDTNPPEVTLAQPAPRSNDTTPTFTGTGSDTKPVTIKIYAGAKAEGTVLATATATGTGGSWTSANATPALAGTRQRYTAVAVQASSIGNAAGTSTPVTFFVDTNAPTLTLAAPRQQSNDASPSFTGTSDEATPVSVEIYRGTSTSGTPVSSAVAASGSGSWATAPANPSLADGQYTAAATQESLFGKEDSAVTAAVSFTIDTAPPLVTLLAPADGSTTSGGTETVSGAAGAASGDLPAVTVQLFAGTTIAPGQSPVQSIVVNALNAAWSATFAGLGPGGYTVRAQQADRAGNVGTSRSATFTVSAPSAGAAPLGTPSASFGWYPANPQVGESVSFVSSSSDRNSPLVGFAWDLAGTGAFAAGGPTSVMRFTTPGSHIVRLRVSDASGSSSLAEQALTVRPLALSMMQPFPIVRITSTASRAGVKLRLLSVSGARGARITVLCKGHGCPVKAQSQLAAFSHSRSAFVEFRRFERTLKVGLTLEIRVSRAGVVGKYTRLVVMPHGRLRRSDACVSGLLTHPITCPS